MALKSINPATGETLATFDTLSPAAVEDKLQRAVAAFASWRQADSPEPSSTARIAVIL